MKIEFDEAKNVLNIEKHGLSLDRAGDMDVLAFITDDRFNEPRFRLYGKIGNQMCCAAVTFREGITRVISLRRAHKKEIKRYADEQSDD